MEKSLSMNNIAHKFLTAMSSSKSEGKSDFFQTFHNVHRDPEVVLHHICRDKLSKVSKTLEKTSY